MVYNEKGSTNYQNFQESGESSGLMEEVLKEANPLAKGVEYTPREEISNSEYVDWPYPDTPPSPPSPDRK